MTNNQDPVVEAFLEALRRDPEAPRPEGIAPDYANFLRMLVRTQHVSSEVNMQQHIWTGLQHRPAAPARQPLALTALVVMVLVGFVFFMASRNNRPPAMTLAQTEATATATPFPATVAPPTEIPMSTSPTGTPMSIPPTMIPIDASPTVIPTVNPPVTSVPPIPSELNKRYSGTLTETQREVSYSFTMPAQGIFYGVLTSPDFSLGETFGYMRAGENGGGGGGSGGNIVVPRNDLYAWVEAGSVVTIGISSHDGRLGRYELGAYFEIPSQATPSTNSPFSVSDTWQPDKPFKAYMVPGNAGSLLNARVATKEDAAFSQPLDLAMTLWALPTTPGGSIMFSSTSSQPCFGQFDLQYCTDLDSGNGVDPELLNVMLRRKTIYFVLLRAQNDVSVQGDYSLQLSLTPAPILESGGTQTVKLRENLTSSAYTTAVKQGETVKFDAAMSDGVPPLAITVTTEEGLVLWNFTIKDHTPIDMMVQAPFAGNLLIFVDYAYPTQNTTDTPPPIVMTLKRR